MTPKRPLSCRLNNAAEYQSITYISEYTDFCSTDLDTDDDDDGEEVSSPLPAEMAMVLERRHSQSLRSYDSKIFHRVPAIKAPKKTKVQDMATCAQINVRPNVNKAEHREITQRIIPEDIDTSVNEDEDEDDGCCSEGKEQFISMMMESLGAVIRSENGGPACSSTCSSSKPTPYRHRIESRPQPSTGAGSNPVNSTISSRQDAGSTPINNANSSHTVAGSYPVTNANSSRLDVGSNPTTTTILKPSTSCCSSSINHHHPTETLSLSNSDESAETQQQLHNYNSDVELEIQQLLAQASADCSSNNYNNYSAEIYQDSQLWRPSEIQLSPNQYCNSVELDQNITAFVQQPGVDITRVNHDHDHNTYMQGFCSLSDIGLMNNYMTSCTEPLNPLSLYSLNSPLY